EQAPRTAAMSNVKTGEAPRQIFFFTSGFLFFPFRQCSGVENVFLASSNQFRCSSCYPCTAPVGTAPVDSCGHGQETSAPNLQSGPLPAPVRLRARAVSNPLHWPS